MPEPKITADDVAALAYDAEGNPRTQVDIALELGVSVATVRRARVSDPERTPPARFVPKTEEEAKLVYDTLVQQLSENFWAPSQRDLAVRTGLTLSRVNFLLQYLRGQGLIELGPNPREIRIVGASMVIPQVTM